MGTILAAEVSAGGLAGLTSSLASGLKDVADSAMSAIGTVVPYALPIVGAVIVVTVGIRIFKRVAK